MWLWRWATINWLIDWLIDWRFALNSSEDCDLVYRETLLTVFIITLIYDEDNVLFLFHSLYAISVNFYSLADVDSPVYLSL